MDTVNKLTLTSISVYEVSKEYEYDLGSISIIVIEFLFNYVFSIAVNEGGIVDNTEGFYALIETTTASILDLEVVIRVRNRMK